jgi:hypothetical protein
MKVRWEVSDGYVGKSRPQYTEIPDDELAECETEFERQQLIDDYVESDFQSKIAWSIVGYEKD